MGITLKSTLDYLKEFDSYSPYQEAIEKVSTYIEQFQANYENRLKNDMIAILTEIQLEIEELPPHREYLNGYDNAGYKCTYGYKEYPPLAEDVNEIIQQKIDKLRGTDNEVSI